MRWATTLVSAGGLQVRVIVAAKNSASMANYTILRECATWLKVAKSLGNVACEYLVNNSSENSSLQFWWIGVEGKGVIGQYNFCAVVGLHPRFPITPDCAGSFVKWSKEDNAYIATRAGMPGCMAD